jgi:beta-phosphoglucomutase-like phosphatase (HAD superfamily)
MQHVEGILFEPVGCLAEFPPEPFQEISATFYGRKGKASKSGSRSYWHLLNLMEAANGSLSDAALQAVSELEREAASNAHIYEDVLPALKQLAEMDLKLLLASSLSSAALEHFRERLAPAHISFASVTSRDDAHAVKAGVLAQAIHSASLDPGRTIFLTDTLEGIRTAKEAGVHPVLMMNDADEARRLAMHQPAGGIVSLHELPDLIRFVRAKQASTMRP